MKRSAPGFTFIEIIAVVLLIALVSGVLVTRMGGRTSAPLRGSGRLLAAELEYVAQRAIATGRTQRWVVDLDQQLFRVEEQPETQPPEIEGEAAFDLAPPLVADAWEPIPERQGNWRELHESTVGIDSVVLGGEPLRQGQIAIHFEPDGGADPADVWLVDEDSRQLRVFVSAFTGEVHVGEAERGA